MAIKVTQVLDLVSQRLTNVGTPSASTDGATKGYVDSAIQGVDWKASVRLASTGTVNLAAPGSSMDGVTFASGDRFLAKDQSTGSQVGIYVWNGAASAATRATDADTAADLNTGAAVSVEEGTANAGKTFILITPGPITLGTTALSFTQLAGSSTYTGGAGLTLTGTTFAVGAGTGMIVNADDVAVDTSVVCRKYATNVGDGSSTSIAVTHGLGTYDVQVTLYTNSGVRDDVMVEVQRTSTTVVTLVFGTAPASAAYRAVVFG